MEDFTKVHQDCIVGMLHGFDRVVFRGTLRSVSYDEGLAKYMNKHKILLKDFEDWAQRCTRRLSAHIEAVVKQAGRSLEYLRSSQIDKEQRALAIAREQGITRGLVCAFSCVEPCHSPEIHRNAQSKRLELRFVPRKCKYYYLYLIDPVFGWMSIRLQSWIPFDVQVFINGRSYLQTRLDAAGIGYQKQDNCFTRIDDLGKAQKLMDQMVAMNWPKVLGRILGQFWPRAQGCMLPEQAERFYWSIRQSEVATDVMFKDAGSLGAIYPRLCRHAIEALSCQDVLRFFDKSRMSGEVTSSCKKLVQGTRLKHQVGSNWIKMYDKAGSVLRIETTINDPSSLRVFRGTLEEPEKDRQWRAMAKAVADIERRVAFCRQANERYLSALAPVGRRAVTAAVLDPLALPVVRGKSRCRGLRPVSPDDAGLLAAMMDGRNLIDGITNGRVQSVLYADAPADVRESRRRSNATGRKLRLLRAHGFIQKVGARRLYRVTARGRQAAALTQAIRQSTDLLAVAA